MYLLDRKDQVVIKERKVARNHYRACRAQAL